MSKAPSTNATWMLKAAGIPYTEHLYRYEERGGTALSARELGVVEHAVIKTLVFEDDQRRPFLVLMHGDREVSVKELARQMGARSVQPCAPETADKHSGYQVGGTSPFGTRKPMPVYAEVTIFELDRIWINGGAKGFLVALAPAALKDLLKAVPVRVGLA
ncbi:MAG TPA: aminoacyl-tRNA deacylase [Holophagaceae bacterium]|jgi:Cys-tRNA(Pro) deacylase|nr:aminoacyl-tRNA deacylase [Holophagaceae bacterium]